MTFDVAETIYSPYSPPLAWIKHGSKRIQSKEIWTDITVEVYPGEFILIVGQNGAGKTTLLHSLLGLNKLTTGQSHSCTHKSIITQLKPDYPLFPLTGLQLITYAQKHSKNSNPQAIDRAIDLTNSRTFYKQRIDQLSGGQWQRIRIAASIVTNPQLLGCDEPFTGLDVMSAHGIVEDLRTWQQDSGRSIVMISHEIAHILPFCDRIFLLADQALQEITHTQALSFS